MIKNPQKGIVMIYFKISKKNMAKDIKAEEINKKLISKSNK